MPLFVGSLKERWIQIKQNLIFLFRDVSERNGPLLTSTSKISWRSNSQNSQNPQRPKLRPSQIPCNSKKKSSEFGSATGKHTVLATYKKRQFYPNAVGINKLSNLFQNLSDSVGDKAFRITLFLYFEFLFLISSFHTK